MDVATELSDLERRGWEALSTAGADAAFSADVTADDG